MFGFQLGESIMIISLFGRYLSYFLFDYVQSLRYIRLLVRRAQRFHECNHTVKTKGSLRLMGLGGQAINQYHDQ